MNILYCIDAGAPVDMWALGVVTYVLVRGRMPFPCDDQSTTLLFDKIKKGEYSLRDSKWDRISAECKDLIRHLLNVNELERYTVDQALAHPWVRQLLVTLSSCR
jgi:serine/threonine protein kinase